MYVYSGTSLLWTPLGQVKECRDYRGVLISEVHVVLNTNATFGTRESVLIIKVSLFQSVLIREVPLTLTSSCNLSLFFNSSESSPPLHISSIINTFWNLKILKMKAERNERERGSNRKKERDRERGNKKEKRGRERKRVTVPKKERRNWG